MTETIMGLRLATGAFRSCPIPSILNVANTPPLDLKITQNYILQKARKQHDHELSKHNKTSPI